MHCGDAFGSPKWRKRRLYLFSVYLRNCTSNGQKIKSACLENLNESTRMSFIKIKTKTWSKIKEFRGGVNDSFPSSRARQLFVWCQHDNRIFANFSRISNFHCTVGLDCSCKWPWESKTKMSHSKFPKNTSWPSHYEQTMGSKCIRIGAIFWRRITASGSPNLSKNGLVSFNELLITWISCKTARYIGFKSQKLSLKNKRRRWLMMHNYAGMPPPRISQILRASTENLGILRHRMVENELGSKMVSKRVHLPSKFLSWSSKKWRSVADDSRWTDEKGFWQTFASIICSLSAT